MGFKVIALDLSPDMIKKTKRNGKYLKISYICGDINEIRFKQKYEAIWACSSLHNMKFSILKKSLNTIFKILEPKGVLSITMRKGTFEGYKTRNKIKRYYRYSNPKEIKMLLKKYNLK